MKIKKAIAKKRIKYKKTHKKRIPRNSRNKYINKILIIFFLLIIFSYFFTKEKNKFKNLFDLKRYQSSVFPEIISFENNLNLSLELFQEFRQINRENKLIEENIKFIKSDNPIVTVIMTIYNQDHCLHKGLRSIQNQSIKNIEIIIIDDCSTDNSVEKIKEYQKEDPRIILISHDSNEGKIKSRSDGIRKAKGKYITVVDGDDAFIHKDVLKNSLFIAQKANLDAVQFLMAFFKGGRLRKITGTYSFTNITNIIYQPELTIKFYPPKKNGLYYLKNRSIWGKLIKNELFQRILEYIGPEYTEDYINDAEDTIMAMSLFHLANSYYIMKELGYYYSLDQKKDRKIINKNIVCKDNNKLKGFDKFKFVKFLVDKNNKNDKEKLITYDEANDISCINNRLFYQMKLDNRHFEIMFFVFDNMLKWDILNQDQKAHLIHLRNKVIDKRNQYNKNNQ